MIKFSSKEHLIEDINSEVQVINSYLTMQTALTEQLSVFINSNTEKLNLDTAIINLNRLKQNILLLQNLLSILENLQSTINFLTPSGLKTYLEDYNALYKNNITNIFSYTTNIEHFIHELSLGIIDVVNADFVDEKQELLEEEKTVSNQVSDSEVSYNSVANNVLVISEIRNEVILPYNLENVKLYYKNHMNKFSSIEDIIKQNYTVPLSYYKPYSIARFRESYKLIRRREHGSRFNALSLAFEMLTNYNLHPAIISACKSIDALDIYLACLGDNKLEEFDIFDIKYEIPPVLSKNQKKSLSLN